MKCIVEVSKMNPIYTGLDIGNGEIKVIVGQVQKDTFYVLASTSLKSKGMKKNTIYDQKKLKETLHQAISQTELKLGMKIKEVILCVPTGNAMMTIESGLVNLKDNVVTGKDIKAVLNDASKGTYDNTRELVTCLPVSFTVDDMASSIDPLGQQGEKLFTKAVVATSEKKEIYPLIEIVHSLGINIVDIIYNAQADYYTVNTKELDRKMGCMINIGADMTTVAIFNKGIMIKNSYIPVGSSSVDKDISFIYKIDTETARYLKETFALTVGRYASTQEVIEVKTMEQKTINIKQSEISSVIESRLAEILKLAKNEINRLTKREISYIIVVGGVSEIAGFNYLVEDILGKNARCFNMQQLGARHNKYTSALGSCKYFYQKCNRQQIQSSMFSSIEQAAFEAPKKRSPVNEVVINKFFGHFFDN